MPDFTVDPAALDSAASTVSGEASTVTGLAGQITPPAASSCGSLLSNAFALTFPAATDGAKAYVQAMGTGADGISAGLTESAKLYRATEDDAVDLAGTIWGDV